jgi:hypothetical protein
LDSHRLKCWAVPGIPAALSLCLSVFTVGRHPFWQDSGLYLTALKELGVLYPPGFTLYEVLCFSWTRLLGFLDFTLAVHLFSSLCAAAASAVTALATRDFLRSRGRIFGGVAEDGGASAHACGALAGVLMAGGFTLWSTAIYAKVYAFYYLMLALLLWRLIRADDSGRPRDFTFAAAMIGLSWQAHPSATLMGPALLMFVGMHLKTLGGKGLAGRTAVAAACALGPSIVLLPILVSRDPWLAFGRPQGAGEFLKYVAGIRFLGEHDAFGLDGTRAASFFRYTWEDLLGVGTALTAVGLAFIARRSVRALAWILAWVLPYSIITILFKTEVQHDCWFVGARLPLFLAAGAGASRLAAAAGARATVVLAAAGAIATAWAAAANGPDVSQRNYLLAEHYGRIVLDRVDRDAILILSGDDANGLAGYLQRVRGERPDVILVTSSFLGSGERTGDYWYERSLFARHPTLAQPDYTPYWREFPGIERKQKATAAFINANAGSRPIFCSFGLLPELLRPDLLMIPAGVHWKVVPRAAVPPVDVGYWKFPIEPEQIRPLYRRVRGQSMGTTASGLSIKPERYERRLAALILMARFRLALAQLEAGQFAQAARLCQSVIDYDDEEFESNPEIIHLLGISYYASGQFDRAELPLRKSAELSARKENRATALYYLGEIAAKKGAVEEARRYHEQAFSIPGLDPAVLQKMKEWRKPR